MKFIHTADLHLGYKYSSEYSEETLLYLKENQNKMLSNIIDAGNKRQIDALLIAGDLFDTPKVTKELFNFVKKEFGRADFKIFIICGNHDPKQPDSIYEKEKFPDNVYLFSEEISEYSFDEYSIFGYSFSDAHKTDNTFAGFTAPDNGKINIMLAHGELAKESYYNPISNQDIEKSGLNYLALGHIHISDGIKKLGNTFYGYSGTPQGSTFKETIDASVIYGEITEGFLRTEKIPVWEHCFCEIKVDVDMPETEDDIISAVKNKLVSSDIQKTLYNVTVNGYIRQDADIDYDNITDKLSRELKYIRINFRLNIRYNIDLLKYEQSLKGEFVRNALKELEGKDDDYIMKVIEYGVSRL